MDQQDPNPLYDLTVALGMLIAFLLYGPVYLAYAAVRNLALR